MQDEDKDLFPLLECLSRYLISVQRRGVRGYVPVLGIYANLVRIRICGQYLWQMDPKPDPTPEPTSFFSGFKDAKKIFFSLRKVKDPDPDPYPWLIDPDPGGSTTCGSGSPTLICTIRTNKIWRIVFFPFSPLTTEKGGAVLYRDCHNPLRCVDGLRYTTELATPQSQKPRSPSQGRIRIRIRISLSCWIRIPVQIADPDPGGQKWSTKKKKVQNFYVLKCGLFSFEGWRLLL